MDEIDIRILQHIGRYSLTLRKVLQVMFFDGRSPQTVLKRLEKLGYIQRMERELLGKFSYYQLTRRGAAIVNISGHRAKPMRPKGLAQDLAALWFCCMGDSPRKRLLDSELRSLFGAPIGNNIIFAAQEHDEPAVFRLYIPDPDCNLERYASTLKNGAHKVCADEKLLRWIERGTYQFAVLLTNEDRKDQLAKLIREGEFPSLRIQIAVAPSPRDLPLFISTDKETTES
jgi:hypothetical protein